LNGRYADVLVTDGPHYAAMLRPAGRQLAREGPPPPVVPTVNIGNFINTMLGGNVQGVGLAQTSEISQVVNDAGLLSDALDTLGSQLVDAERGGLPGQELERYAQTVQELKAELTGADGRRERALVVADFVANGG
jgi:hypothetical protein